ncbi:MAG TPA: hypothetical protein VGE45_00295 [Chloroflexia bacterium]|jgi:hypothetical protein
MIGKVNKLKGGVHPMPYPDPECSCDLCALAHPEGVTIHYHNCMCDLCKPENAAQWVDVGEVLAAERKRYV